ncbi:aldehyde dehydrogenase family protein [Sphingomonadales bacterium 56]|uniref:Aldehyde dehydrogenase family protein n=1 Tax=Sphingobium indicum TaxID=332055 RepID=A0A4V1W9P6_9SPHN|nr:MULTISPECIES: aldehyde dehydrogenase family protein [Sphingobium]MBY2930654.1 aldehyde dehydrogenase family protein [Sphingomonadales bacterium 56]MBY2960646.1 aldehyde dehydrogenase family protein [Sphingomonadales bacterium 58]NYI23856.1 acyl-CoA reductase-like NAD-dependent aldehyde dehydrogenase [Sphingobium indicum]RYM00297.1 aldehyde dehydrogenase family protein [Sphingobium indicum]CAD7341641.1 Succinate-semialdehyde dehydrogenase [NADP(+)] GabD [Sphingobium sp. S8]
MNAIAMTINGRSVGTGATFPVIDPSTGEAFAEAPAASPEQLEEAMATAQDAFASWSRDEGLRRRALKEAAGLVMEIAAEMGPILAQEQGKPLADTGIEFEASAEWLNYYADLELPREIVQDDAAAYAEIVRRPLGVVAGITPWNYPIALAFWKIAPALRAGNTLVLKPSPYTPLSTLAVGQALQSILPPGVLNVISGPDPLGAAMTAHATPRKLTFTGSTATGRKVMVSGANDLKRVTLELGGNDPAVILDDADISAIADELFWGAFANNGQVCVAIKRIYVHESRHDELVEALAERARSVAVGAWNEEGALLGPLCNRPQFERVKELVAEAIGMGARVAAGGAPMDRPGFFFQPTILADLDERARIVSEEQFGPALPILSYSDVDDAVARANAGPFGLTASVWSSDPIRAANVGLGIEAGQVQVNGHAMGLQPHLPFGGLKSSGIGVENGPWGLHGFTDIQLLYAPPRRAAA